MDFERGERNRFFSSGAAFGVEITAHPYEVGELAVEHDVERHPACEGSVGHADPFAAAIGVAEDDPGRLPDVYGVGELQRVADFVSS